MLDPRRMTRVPNSRPLLRCHACGENFPVRDSDLHRPVPAGPPLEPPKPEKRRRWLVGRR